MVIGTAARFVGDTCIVVPTSSYTKSGQGFKWKASSVWFGNVYVWIL